MGSIFSRIGKIVAVILDILVNTANLFLGDIVVSEAEGIKFDWQNLLHSYVFWGMIIANVFYFSAAYASNHKEQETDETVRKSFAEFTAQMYSLAAEEMRNGHYDSSKKVLNVLWKAEKRRRR